MHVSGQEAGVLLRAVNVQKPKHGRVSVASHLAHLHVLRSQGLFLSLHFPIKRTFTLLEPSPQRCYFGRMAAGYLLRFQVALEGGN